MSNADRKRDEQSVSGDGTPELYVKYVHDKPVKYVYGDPWIAQALFLDDIGYDTPEEAKMAWEKGVN